MTFSLPWYLISPWQTFVPQTSITFVSKASVDTGTVQNYKLRKRIEVVKNCRNIGKKDMKYNDLMPRMKVDPELYVSILVVFDDEYTDAKECTSRSSKQMEIYVKPTPPQSYRWHRCIMSIKVNKLATTAVVGRALVCLQNEASMIRLLKET